MIETTAAFYNGRRPASWRAANAIITLLEQDALLSHGGPRDAAVNFGTYRSLQQRRAVFTAIATLSN